MPKLTIPPKIAFLTEGASGDVTLPGASLTEVFSALESQHRAIHSAIISPQGRVRPYVRIIVGSKDVTAEIHSVKVEESSVIHILVATAGG